jgi:hypothetical protein
VGSGNRLQAYSYRFFATITDQLYLYAIVLARPKNVAFYAAVQVCDARMPHQRFAAGYLKNSFFKRLLFPFILINNPCKKISY